MKWGLWQTGRTKVDMLEIPPLRKHWRKKLRKSEIWDSSRTLSKSKSHMLSWNPHTQSFYQTVGSPEVDIGVVGYISFRRMYERKESR
jgi:hypothetical protein